MGKQPQRRLSRKRESGEPLNYNSCIVVAQVYLDTTGVGSRRSGSADGGLASIGRSAPWLPDYTLRAITDIVYLKIRSHFHFFIFNFLIKGTRTRDYDLLKVVSLDRSQKKFKVFIFFINILQSLVVPSGKAYAYCKCE